VPVHNEREPVVDVAPVQKVPHSTKRSFHEIYYACGPVVASSLVLTSTQEEMVDGKKKNKKSQYQKPTRTNENQDQEVSGAAIETNYGRSSNRSAIASPLDGRDLIYVSPTRVCSIIFSRDAAMMRFG